MSLSGSESLTMPNPEPSGFVRTLNNMGYMTSVLDPFSQEFAEFAPHGPGPALDVGCAYGIATRQALRNGAHVIANDIDERHLRILEDSINKAEAGRLSLAPGRFPEELGIEHDSVGSILIARVLHFFSGDAIEEAFRKCYLLLRPGGRLFIVAETPHLRNFQGFSGLYEHSRRSGVQWPGFIPDVMAVAPERGQFLPKSMHLLDPSVLCRTALKAGFQIHRCSYISRTDFPEDIRFDGRESVGLVVEKL